MLHNSSGMNPRDTLPHSPMKQNPVNCHRCRHFYVTWDPRFPNGCRALNFKTREIPSMVVLRSSGEPCHFYNPKDPGPKTPKKKPLVVA